MPGPSVNTTGAQRLHGLCAAPLTGTIAVIGWSVCLRPLSTCSTPFELEMLQTVPLLAAAHAVRMQHAALGSNGGFKPFECLQDSAAQRAAAHRVVPSSWGFGRSFTDGTGTFPAKIS